MISSWQTAGKPAVPYHTSTWARWTNEKTRCHSKSTASSRSKSEISKFSPFSTTRRISTGSIGQGTTTGCQRRTRRSLTHSTCWRRAAAKSIWWKHRRAHACSKIWTVIRLNSTTYDGYRFMHPTIWLASFSKWKSGPFNQVLTSKTESVIH